MHDRSRDDPLRTLLFTDLYELTMAQAYEAEGTDQEAVFALFFRKLPPGGTHRRRRARGRARLLGNARRQRGRPRLPAQARPVLRAFLERLRGFRFTGEVWAVPEGTIVFPTSR